MRLRLIAFALALATTLMVLSPQVYAQAPDSPPGQEAGIVSGPRKQLATIIFAGLAGAILGLSTLSFYGRPQEKLSNIAVGFAVGIIVGTSYTTYKAATAPYEFLSENPREHHLDYALVDHPPATAIGASYQWTY